MSKAAYIGVDGIARKVKKIYIGVDGVARKVKKAYIGVPNFTPRILPSGYTQVEYIESSGTQYLDTGFKPNQDTRIVIDHDLYSQGSYPALFGAWNSGISSAYIATSESTTQTRVYYNTQSLLQTASLIGRHVTDMNKNVLTIDGSAVITGTITTFQCNYPLFLFTMNDAGTPRTKTNIASMKLYSCQIYDNGTLVREYVPCINSSGMVGLYDIQNGVFYGNAGTGVFAAGPTYHNVARLFYSGGTEVTYSGTHTASQVTINGVLHNMLTITGSGTLTVDGEGVQYWMCGGGAGGGNAAAATSTTANSGMGGGGGYTAFIASMESGVYTLAIGAAGSAARNGGASQITNAATNEILATANGGSPNGSGGTGGGASIYINTTASYGWAKSNAVGTGDKVSKYPFGVTSLKAHCAGGGGGGLTFHLKSTGAFCNTGGKGGSNGANGDSAYINSYAGVSPNQVAAASQGGGCGGLVKVSDAYTSNFTHVAATAATFYGAGGGGGAAAIDEDGDHANTAYKTGAKGYQGVVYVAWPA